MPLFGQLGALQDRDLVLLLGHLGDQEHLAVAFDDVLEFVALGSDEGRLLFNCAMAGLAADLLLLVAGGAPGVGLFLLAGFLLASYRTITSELWASASLGSLTLAVWTILLFYNVTESAFRCSLLWVLLLLGVIAVPGRSDHSP